MNNSPIKKSKPDPKGPKSMYVSESRFNAKKQDNLSRLQKWVCEIFNITPIGNYIVYCQLVMSDAEKVKPGDTLISDTSKRVLVTAVIGNIVHGQMVPEQTSQYHMTIKRVMILSSAQS